MLEASYRAGLQLAGSLGTVHPCGVCLSGPVAAGLWARLDSVPVNCDANSSQPTENNRVMNNYRNSRYSITSSSDGSISSSADWPSASTPT